MNNGIALKPRGKSAFGGGGGGGKQPQELQIVASGSGGEVKPPGQFVKPIAGPGGAGHGADPEVGGNGGGDRPAEQQAISKQQPHPKEGYQEPEQVSYTSDFFGITILAVIVLIGLIKILKKK